MHKQSRFVLREYSKSNNKLIKNNRVKIREIFSQKRSPGFELIDSQE